MASTYATNPYRGVNTSLPAGYMQAATEPGRNIARGIEKLGEGLGSAVEGYMAGRKENAELDAQYESLAREVISQPISLSDDDPMKGELESRASELVKSGEGWKDMSRAKKKQLIADLVLFRDMQAKSAQRQVNSLQLQEIKGQRDAANLAAQGMAPTVQEKEVPNMVEQTQPMIGPLPEEYYTANEMPDFNALANRPMPEQQALTAPEPEFRPNVTLTPDQYAVSEVSRSAPKNLPEGYDAEFFRETLARTLDSISEQVGSSTMTRIPAEYQVGGGWAHNERDPANVPKHFIDKVPTGERGQRGRIQTRDVINPKRVGAFIQQLKSNGVDTPALRQLEYLSKLYGGPQAQPGADPTAPPQGYASAPAPLPMTTVYSQSKPRPTESFTVQDGTKLVPTTPEDQMAERRSRFDRLAQEARGLGLEERFIQQARQSVFPKQAMPQVVTVNGIKFFDDGSGKFTPVPNQDKSKMTESQVKSMKFYQEMMASKASIDEIVAGGFDPTSSDAIGTAVSRMAMPADAKSYVDSTGKWIEAVLRDRSGAAIAEHEYVSARNQFFPTFRDSPEAVARKARLREAAEQAMLAAMQGVSASDIDFSHMTKADGSEFATKPSGATKAETVKVNLGEAIIERD